MNAPSLAGVDAQSRLKGPMMKARFMKVHLSDR
jgi:hypothetical protein